MFGSAKISSGASESSSGSSSAAGSASSSGSSGSSSCVCGFEVTEITLTSALTGSYVVTNTGCGEVIIVAHVPAPAGYDVGDFTLSEGESTTVLIESESDLRLTSFTVLTDCSDKDYSWPDFP